MTLSTEPAISGDNLRSETSATLICVSGEIPMAEIKLK
jgi:hypothetical protein